MIKLYGHFLSMPSLKTRFVANYIGTPYEHVHVDISKGENGTDAFRKINPAARLPALTDGDLAMGQSDAICRYLAALAGDDSFYPSDPKARAKVNEWTDYASQHILTAMGRIFFNQIVAPMLGETADENSIKFGRRVLERDLPNFEAAIAKNTYIVSGDITLADLTLLSALEPAEMVQIDLSPYPAMAAWRTKLMAMDFYTSVHTHFAAEIGR